MKRRWLRLLIFVSAGLVLVFLGLFVVLQTPMASRLILKRAQTYLNNSGINLSSSRMSLNLLGRAVTLENVVVGSSATPDLPPFFIASRVYAKLNVLMILRGMISLDALDVSGPKISYVIREDGRSNLPESAKQSGGVPDFLIARADLDNGSLGYQDRQNRTSLSLPKWRASVDGNRLTLRHHIDFTTQGSGSFDYQGRTTSIGLFRFLGTLEKRGVQAELVRLGIADSQVSISGSLRDFSDPKLDLQLNPALNLKDLSRILDLREPIEGAVSGSIRATGRLQDLQLEARLQGRDVNAFEFRKINLDLKTLAQWSSPLLALRNFELNTSAGSANGNAELYLGGEPGTNSVKAALRNFDVYPVWKQLKAPFDIASRVSGKISLDWKGPLKTTTLAANARLNIAATQNFPRRNLLPISGTLEAEMRSGRVSGTMRNFSIMGTQMDGSFALLSFETIDASLRGTVSDINTPLTQVSQFLGSGNGSIAGTRVAGPVQFEIEAGGRLSNPRIIVAASSPSIEIDRLKDLKMETTATIQNSTAAFQLTTTLPQNSTVLANGVLGFGGNTTTLRMDASTEQMPASAALSMLGSSIPAEGTLKSNLHLEGPLEELTGTASVTGDQISVYQQTVGHFETQLKMAGEEIRSDLFRIVRDPSHPATNYIDAQFTYGLKSDHFQFEARGKDLVWDRLILPGGKALEGTANLVATGTGTVANPYIDLKLESDDLRLQQTSFGPASISAALRGEKATIEALAPRLNLTLNAHLNTRSPYAYDGELQIRNSDLSILGLTGPNGQPLTGAMEGDIKGSGHLNEVAESRMSTRIQKLELHAGDLEIHTDGPIQAEYLDRSIELPKPAALISGNSRLEVAGRVPLRQSGSSGTMTIKGQIDLAQATGFLPMPKGFDAAGTLNVDLALLGTPKRLKTTGTISMDNGIVHLPRIGLPLSDIVIRAELQEGSLVLQRGDAVLGESRIALQGEFPFGLLPKNIPVQFPRKEGPARLVLDLASFRPESTGLLPQDFGGLISLHATAQAARLDMQALNAEIVFRDMNLKANEISLGQDGPSTIRIRNGVASIAKLELTGSETSVAVTGSAGLFRDGPLNFRIVGNLDSALLNLFLGKDLKMAGKLQARVVVGGNWKAPSLSGLAEMKGGHLRLQNPKVVADSLNMRLDFTPSQITVREFKGTLNGGSITMDGTIGFQKGTLNNFDLKATLQDVFLDFPEGLKSALNGNLTITSAEESIVIGGTVRILESSYREPFTASGQIMNYLKSQRVVVGSSKSSAFLERIRFNLALRSATPLLVQNNIAKVEATVNLRLVGSFYEPSLVGRVTLDQGGEIVMNQRTYYIQRGTITLNDQSEIKPDLDIEAQTRIDVYDITMRLTGPPERLSPTLTSEPALQEQDILSLLLTGRIASESTQQMARTQALSIIAGQASEEVTREARQALHITTFRIDPGLISPESDPGARLTIGESISRNFNIAYSMNLVNGGDQIWVAQYNVTRTLTTQATKQQDNSSRYEFRHDLRFGGQSTRPNTSGAAAAKFRIGSIQFEGTGGEFDKVLREKFRLRSGDTYDFPKVQKGLDRLHEFYTGQRRLEADIRLRRETSQKTVNLDISVAPGPVVDFTYDGMPLSSRVKGSVEKAWKNGVFDIERLDDAVAAIRRPLLQEGYLQSEITPKVETQGDKKIVHFHIVPGTRYENVPVVFTGASQIRAGELSNALDHARLGLEVYADPQGVADYFKQYYLDRGYLQASVETPQPHLDPKTGTGQVVIPVHEGPLFTVGDLGFSGNSAFDYDQLWSVIPTSSGSICTPRSLQESARALESLYQDKGYHDASVEYHIVEDSKTARANITFKIMERRQSIIRDIVIEGNLKTNDHFIRSQLDFQKGDYLDINRINESRRRLYSTGAYTSVDFQTEDLSAAAPNPREKDIRIRIRLRETRPYRLQYGFFVDTERGPGGLLEAQNLNVRGRAAIAGLRLRYDSDLKEARVYFNQPFVTKLHLKMDVSAFAQRETRTAFSANSVGFSLFRQKALSRKYMFNYGYRYDNVHWIGLPPDPTIFQANFPVARLIATLTRDTRDSVLDATRGEFTSHSLEFGPHWLGSEIGFIRYYGQYFRYVPLDKYLGKNTKDNEGKPIPTSFVYAGALRLGLISPFQGGVVTAPERFFAGGGTTMRGFEQDLLGPVITLPGDIQRPLGGEALFLFNNEIRFPIVSILQGVGFVDIGNVYPQLSDFNFNLRKSAGVGLRIKIKYIPLRFDYGLKLDRRPGESKGAFFFSIGQAF